MEGAYQVATDMYGDSEVRFEIRIGSDYSFVEDSSIFIAAIAVAQGQFDERSEILSVMQTIDIWSFGYGWEVSNLSSDRDLRGVRDDPLSTYTDSSYSDEVWTATSYGFHADREFHISAHRKFVNTYDDRDFKLGTVRKFTVGFYDYHDNAGGWTDTMELVLESGYGYEQEQSLAPSPTIIFQMPSSRFSIYPFDTRLVGECLSGSSACEEWSIWGYYMIDSW